MPEAFNKPQELTKNLDQVVNESFKDITIDANEQKEIEERVQAIRDFIEGKDVREPLSENEKQIRESSVIAAIKELDVNTAYQFLYPKNEKEVLNIKPEKFWSKFDEFKKTKPQILVKAALLQQLRLNSNKFLENIDSIPNNYFDKIYIETIFKSNSKAIKILSDKKWKDPSFAEEIFLKIASGEINVPKQTLLFKHVRHKPYAEKVLTKAAQNKPGVFLEIYHVYGTEPYSDQLLEISIRGVIEGNFDLSLVIPYYHLFAGKPYENEILKQIKARMAIQSPGDFEFMMKEAKDYSEYAKQKDILKRTDYLNTLAIKLYPDFQANLDTFNKNHQLSLQLMGMKNQPREFIFINTWENPQDKNKLPIQLSLRPEEIKTDFEQNLQTKIDEEYLTNEKQIAIWKKRGFSFDLPKSGQTSLMLATVPDNLLGIESDAARIAQIFGQEFDVNWQSVLMEDVQEWEQWQDKALKAPENKPPTKKELLKQFETGLKSSIDSKQQHFVLHYLMHGDKDGAIRAKDASFDATEFTKILTQNYKGKPIAAQIDITIIAESCYSGNQLDTIIADLQARKVPTKGLRIITAASRYTSASTFKPNQASLLGDSEMMKDTSGVMTYYLSYYFDLINSMKSEGQKIQPPLGTMGHALAFADRMAKKDGSSHQDLQAYYYSTMDAELMEPEPAKKVDDRIPVSTSEEKGESFGGTDETITTSTKDTEDAKPSGYYFSEKESPDTGERIA